MNFSWRAHSGSFGMGLAIFSRYPIVSTETSSYTYNGLPLAVWKGDWIVGKGAGCATIDVPGLEGGLDVWVTHVSSFLLSS
jgi:sphingomyelin phosphodiesterase 2